MSETVPWKIVGRCGTQASCSPPRVQIEAREVDAAHGHAPGGRLGEAEEKACDGALAGAGLSHEREGLARAKLEVERVEHEPVPRRIGEGDVLETHDLVRR